MSATGQSVVLSSAPYLSGTFLANLVQEQGLELETLSVMMSSASLQHANTSKQVFAKGFSVAYVSGEHSPAFLGLVAASLTAGASLTVYEPANTQGDEAVGPLKKALLLAGFVNSTEGKTMNSAQGQLVCVTANKPLYAVGTKASITLKPKGSPKSKQASWTLPADDNEELLDEDELLTEEDRQRPAVIAADDCDVGAGKKACKNCTCGRADAEAAVQKVDLSQDMIENPQSACGSCGLGDAFRCSTCPYRGLPSFEMGKKIELGSDFLTADA